ncbi:MAG: hemagglutinin repeat-containing protein [Sulfuricurvum sp.]|nr:hemagglutinin repeat-containing protein [Sulfuricurvum sp.]
MMFTHLYRQSISCILSTVLLGNTLYAGGIVVDTTAAASHRPMMESTPNAIPLINIVTPNSTGLSRNKFSEFNIEQRGVIFNNATSAALTQLGGWVQGNSNLGTTPARVILNEVTGTNRSLLSGYGEVAGHRADLIIANPNGITVNGGGFINTSRATLTTGMAQINGDTLAGFHVQRGDILIEGNGFNADNIDRVELYTKALVLNAQFHAKVLDVATGENTITRDGMVTSDNVIGSEPFSIDSSALGGIYGDTIRLVGTDKGVGINLPAITYASDSLSLSADGHIILGSAVAGNTLSSQSGSLTVNELLYGGNSIDLSASDTIHNTPNALILSHGDITIHDTGTLLNDEARIEASGNVVIQADAIENLSRMTPVKTTVSSSSQETVGMPGNWREHKTTNITTDSIDKTDYIPAYILSGGNMLLDGAIHNRYSMIASDGDLYLYGSLNNEAALEAHKITDIEHYVQHKESHSTFGGKSWYHKYTTYEHYDELLDYAYSTISAGGNLYGNLISVNNADVTDGTNFSSKGVTPTSYTQNITTGAINYTLPNGKNGAFVLTTNPALPYLIESNPLFTSYGTFISSDYIMSRLHLDTVANTKRLGDACYETQLVRNAVFRLTGERYLAGFGSDTTQYQALMDNALTVSEELKLELGVTLSASQIARLNRDIVWMEDRVVSGQHVLVPVVYLASLKTQELSSGGKIITGGDIQLAVAQGLNNSGEIRAGGTLLAQADSITNTGGTIKSEGDMLLHTTNDITNTSGTIRGDNVALVSDNGSIISQTASEQFDLSGNKHTTGNLSLVGERSSIQSSGDMVLSAKQDITLTGAETSAGGDIALSATNNVTLSALEQDSHYKSKWGGGSSEFETIKQHASTLSAGGDVSIDTAKDVTLHSSTIAGTNIALNAGENILITAANDREYSDIKSNSKGFLSSKSSRDMTLKENVVSSSIDGNNISITSGKDTTLQAANLKAAQNIQVEAAGDINVLAKAYREASLHQESKSSLGGLVSSASLDSTDALKLHEATVKTEAKNIIMNSGKDITVVASNVSAGDALVLASTGDTNIVSGQEISQSEHWSKKSGFFSGGGNIYSSEFDLKSNADIMAKASTVDGKTAMINSGNDINVKGSAIVGENDVAINSGKNLIIEAANEQHASEEKHESSGFGIYGSSGGLGFTIGEQEKKDALSSDAAFQSQSRSLVGSINGDLTLNAADSVSVQGSDLVAGNDMSIQAKNVTLQESEDATKTKEIHEFRQSGLTVALTGSVVSAAQTVNQMNQASQKTDNTRLKALAAMTTGLGALSAYGDVAGGGTNAIGVSATIGNTQSKSESTSQSHVHSGSSATAGGDIFIIATGDGANSDITISGSDIAAGKNITLKADDTITLKASEDTYRNRSSSSSSSGGVGVAATVGSGGGQLGFTANASMGRGRTNGDDALINNTHITANDTLTISSGGDTTLKGATAKADTIKADVGGDFAIESLQDTSTYASKSQSVGGSVTVGWGGASGSVSYSQTDVKSDYTSVNEQSGLNADNGGFQINVANNTDLKGGLISSSQSAIDNNKNSLTTATLTTSDINNHATASANTSGFSIGTDAASGLYGAAKTVIGSAMMFAGESGSSSGTTKSAISAGTITIIDEAKQKELTGKTAQETIVTLNTDTNNAHTAATKQYVQGMQERVEAQQAINQALFKEAVKFTDEAYRTMFLQKAKIVEILKDENGKVLYDENKNIMTRELSNDEKNNLQKGSDGKVHIVDNGIFNDEAAAAKYAGQHTNADGALYAIHFPEADNGLSEMMVAGYQKYLESDLLGLANATQETKTLMENYGTEGLHLDGHSRGSLTVTNAMDSLANDPNGKGSLSQTIINFFGPAQNVANADETLSYLQNRDSISDIDMKNSMVINYEAHMADAIALLVGWNAATGGRIPQTEPIVIQTVSGFPLSNENTTLAEMLRAATGQKDTSHNLYFLDFNNLQPNSDSNVRVRLFNDFWGGTTPVLKPIRTYKGTK